MDEQKIKEFIFQAHQAGKSETSGLFKDIKDQISELKNNYSKRELDHYFGEVHEKMTEFRTENKTGMDMLDRKITYTNGTVRIHTKVLLVVGTAIVVLLATNGSELISFLKILI